MFKLVAIIEGEAFGAYLDARPEYLYCFDQEWRPGMAGISVTPLDPGAAIAWPLPVDVSDPAQISAKDANAPEF
jgi:dTDP-4-dehydrorhamnose 3,5-epimerase